MGSSSGIGFTGCDANGGGSGPRDHGRRRRVRDRIRKTVGANAPHLKVLEGGRGMEEDLSSGSKLDAETRHQMDDILRIISEQGIDALTDEQRAFLEKTSDELNN